MNKAAPLIIAPIVGGVILLSMAALTRAEFDYATATEERQQKYLDNIARGFSAGFNATSGGSATIKRISANASADVISVDIQFTKKEVETATASAVENFRQFVYKNECAWLEKNDVLEKGVSIKIRMTKPSGSVLTNFNINDEACSAYIKRG